MPSPFPGMDPYLEAPDIWWDCHASLAFEISRRLNQNLPAPYYAKLDSWPERGLDLDESVIAEPLRHRFVEIRDSKREHKLITLIEILSPSNKRTGVDRNAYIRKQREILESDANLIEIDLLRKGDRIYPTLELEEVILQIEPTPLYLVLVNRSWQRIGDQMGYQIFPFGLREWLPCIPVPLREHEADVPLDLQYAFQRAYDTGPYRRGAVDYSQPPEPPLTAEDAEWAEELLRAMREG